MTLDLKPTTYLLAGHLADSPVFLTLRRQDPDSWAITHNGMCMNHQGEWAYEPIPSSRTPEFLANTRWDTPEAAVDAWRSRED